MAPPQWAYLVENYVTPPDEELVCSICRAVFCDPTLCPCDHVFCKACITKWLQNNRNCPICRKRASLVSIKPAVPIVKNIIMKHMLHCRNKTLGCTAKFSVESSEAHIKECGYELVQCKNKPCTDKLFRKDVADHETKDCLHRAIRCKKCKCKIPTSSNIAEHDCIVALRGLVKERSEMVLAKSARIKHLKAEIKNLKSKMKETSHSRLPDFSRSSINSDTFSSISPDEITINIHEFDSASSISSDSDMSSDNFYIFTNESLPDDNDESDSFISMDNDDNVENGDAHDVNEYRNAESQTVEPVTTLQSNESRNSAESLTITEERAPEPVSYSQLVAEVNRVPRLLADRHPKRKPTTQKPAKRRFPPETLSSNDEDDSFKNIWSSILSNITGHSKAVQSEVGTSSASTQADPPSRLMSKKQPSYMEAGPSSASFQSDHPDHLISKKQSSNMEAGPSSASTQADSSGRLMSKKQSSNMEAGPSSASLQSNLPNHSTSKKRSHPRQKRAKQSGRCFRDNAVSSKRIITSDYPVFERTLALLEQHSLESDPEWLPDHIRLRERDTTTESDSSYVVESSDSDLSDVDSLDNRSVSLDDSHHERPDISDFMNWMFESTSEEDPDWKPPDSDEDSV